MAWPVRPWLHSRRRTPARLALSALAFVTILLALLSRSIPLEPPEQRLRPAGLIVLDANGEIIQRDASEGLSVPVMLDQVSPIVVQATVAAEDRRFWLHPGVDPLAVARAALDFDDNGAGASTITQQLARRLYLGDFSGPPLLRKLREVQLALLLERQWSKQRILAAYLNQVYYGRGAYGIEAAARTFFGVSARDLDLARAAVLASLPRAPGVDSPAQAKAGQTYVLDRLVAGGVITPAAASEAAAAQLSFVPRHPPSLAPHFVDFALSELWRLRPDLRDRPGLIVETTLDGVLQAEAERLLRLRLSGLADRRAGNGALVALEPASGRILALVGSADFSDPLNGGQINMALQPRQPGSALKPFLYASAFEHGFTAASPMLDVETAYPSPTGVYQPANYDRRYHGVVPLRVALASSYNVPAVRLLDQLGLDRFMDILHRFGLRTLTQVDGYGLALTLGAGEVRLLDLTAAYGAFATGGLLVEPSALLRVRDATSGELLYQAPPANAQRVLSAEHSYLIADILSDGAARTPGFGEVTPLALSRRAAVKTGTTSDSHDNWTVGFTPDRVIGVWVGNPDNRPMLNVSGVDGAGPIWRDVMQAALADLPERWLDRPAGLVEQPVCTPTGLLPGPDCPAVVNELFVAGSEPSRTERYFNRDDRGQASISPPAEAQPWAKQVQATLGTSGSIVGGADTVRVIQPGPGSLLLLAPELPRQELTFRAAVPAGTTAVEFRLDGQVIGRAAPTDPGLTWRLEPGQHRLVIEAHLADGSTAQASSTYEVRSR